MTNPTHEASVEAPVDASVEAPVEVSASSSASRAPSLPQRDVGRAAMSCSMVLALIGCGPAVASSSSDPRSDSATVSAVASAGLQDHDPALARKLVREQGALLLDVRSQGEFDDGHVEGATLVPHDELESRLAEIDAATGGDKAKPIVVYCRSGRRSAVAKQALLAAGYTQVSDLGGVSSWCETC